MYPDKPWIIGIDPGTDESAYAICDEHLKPLAFEKLPNEQLAHDLFTNVIDLWDGMYGNEPVSVEQESLLFFKNIHLAIEMVASYGMPVGAEVFETCVWIGKFEHCLSCFENHKRIYRKDEKLTICHSPKANDSTIRQALTDRFAYGVSNFGKGTKKEPGWFYGFKNDVWQAYAIAVTYHDMYIKQFDACFDRNE